MLLQVARNVPGLDFVASTKLVLNGESSAVFESPNSRVTIFDIDRLTNRPASNSAWSLIVSQPIPGRTGPITYALFVGNQEYVCCHTSMPKRGQVRIEDLSSTALGAQSYVLSIATAANAGTVTERPTKKNDGWVRYPTTENDAANHLPYAAYLFGRMHKEELGHRTVAMAIPAHVRKDASQLYLQGIATTAIADFKVPDGSRINPARPHPLRDGYHLYVASLAANHPSYSDFLPDLTINTGTSVPDGCRLVDAYLSALNFLASCGVAAHGDKLIQAAQEIDAQIVKDGHPRLWGRLLGGDWYLRTQRPEMAATVWIEALAMGPATFVEDAIEQSIARVAMDLGASEICRTALKALHPHVSSEGVRTQVARMYATGKQFDRAVETLPGEPNADLNPHLALKRTIAAAHLILTRGNNDPKSNAAARRILNPWLARSVSLTTYQQALLGYAWDATAEHISVVELFERISSAAPHDAGLIFRYCRAETARAGKITSIAKLDRCLETAIAGRDIETLIQLGRFTREHAQTTDIYQSCADAIWRLQPGQMLRFLSQRDS